MEPTGSQTKPVEQLTNTRGKANTYQEILRFENLEEAMGTMSGVVAGQSWTKSECNETENKKIRFVCIDESNWRNSKCSCNYWCRHYTWKHSIAICERAKLLDFPEAAKQIPIKGKRKPGRPRTTASALQYQPTDEQSDEEVYSETGKEEEEVQPIPAKKRGPKKIQTTRIVIRK